MNTNRFANCTTQDEAVKIWRTLSKELHPDMHQDNKEHWTEEFKKLNAEFAAWSSGWIRYEQKARQDAAHSDGRKSAADYHDIDNLAEELRTRIENALNLGMDVELIGLWIWVTGPKTYENRNALYEMGFKYAKKKSDKTAYYYAAVPSFNRERGRTLDEIRSMHGSTKYTKRNKTQDEETTVSAGIPATV